FVSHDKQCPFRNYTIEFMKENNLSKKQLQQLDSYSLIQEFIAQGKGLAFLPINNDKLEKIEEVPIQKIPINFFTIRESEKIIPSELFD
ncbi:LysR family transcriptional regulator, partial [Bacillus sp. JJ1127]